MAQGGKEVAVHVDIASVMTKWGLWFTDETLAADIGPKGKSQI